MLEKLFNKKNQNETIDIKNDSQICDAQNQDIQKDKRLIYGLLGVIFLFSLIGCMLWKDGGKWNSEFLWIALMELCIALMGSFFILFFIELNKRQSEDAAHKRELRKIVKDTLTDKKDGIIPKIEKVQTNHKNALERSFVDCLVKRNTLVSKLNDSSVDTFMQDCISHYCQHLSEHYKNYIKDSIHVFRKDFQYKVTVSRQQNKDNITEQYISQNITYERFFRDCDNRERYQLKCLFTFGTNELDEALEDDSYFFREELTNPELLNRINNILNDPTKNVIDELINKEETEDFKLEITIGKDKIKNSEIKYEVIKNESKNTIGLLFYVNIPNNHIHHTEGSYIHYKGGVSCKYKSDINNIFYCIFSNPTIGSTYFNIKFEGFSNEFNVDNDVIRLPILSLKRKDFNLTPYILDKSINFNTPNTIFPRSGIVIRW